MFYFFIFELCCITVKEDRKYCGFNEITIQFLDVHDFYSGWFTEKKYNNRFKSDAKSRTA